MKLNKLNYKLTCIVVLVALIIIGVTSYSLVSFSDSAVLKDALFTTEVKNSRRFNIISTDDNILTLETQNEPKFSIEVEIVSYDKNSSILKRVSQGIGVLNSLASTGKTGIEFKDNYTDVLKELNLVEVDKEE